MKDFQEVSYELHRDHRGIDLSQLELYRNWFQNNTVDVWRHVRMLENINPFLKHYPGAKWLAIGDGNFGTSATYINNHGGKALPADLNVELLKAAKENNLIGEYAHANAEELPFENQAFDFTFCKESFHHFPRPFVALYEMLRVSRRAVILIEPGDWLPLPVPRQFLQRTKNFLKKIFKMPVPHSDTGNYEPVGNYVFTVSEREIQKIASGVNLPAVAFKKFHDVYIEGMEHEKADSKSSLLKKAKRKIFLNKIFYNLGLNGMNQIAAIIFKESPPDDLISDLKLQGFEIIQLPRNPYVQ